MKKDDPNTPETMKERVAAAKQQAQIRELEVLVGKLTEQNQDYAHQITNATKEVGRLRNIEADSIKFRRMVTLPSGELYYGALFEAIDADGDGVLDTHVLIQGAPDTLKLTPAEIANSERLRRELLDSPQTGPSERDALQYLGTHHATSAQAGSAQDVLEQTVEAVEAQN